jgi:16S rRNA C967 or C1407 C5-methylase (RsmB/RsmF family)
VVYSVCTWTRAETDEVVDELLRRRPDLAVPQGGRRQLWPHRDDADGVYLARLVKTAQPPGSR